MPGGEFAGRCIGGEQFRQCFDLDRDRVGCVFRRIRVGCKNDRDRLADIAHAVPGENRLPIGLEPLDAGKAKIDRRNCGDVRRRPNRDGAGHRACRVHIDGDDASMRMGRTDHAHVQLMRKRDVGGEASLAGDQRPIL